MKLVETKSFEIWRGKRVQIRKRSTSKGMGRMKRRDLLMEARRMKMKNQELVRRKRRRRMRTMKRRRRRRRRRRRAYRQR